MHTYRRIWPILAAATCLWAGASSALAGAYEVVVTPGSSAFSASEFRVTVATGPTAVGAGSTATYAVIAEPVALPPGDYHLVTASQPQMPDGRVIWSVTRYDAKSGRMWNMTGCGTAPCVWVEMTAAH